MPKAFADREKEIIGERLLDQGKRLFTAYGLRKANVEEIAKAAGISKGAFYNFYDSKEALFMAVVEQVESQVRQQILAAVDRPGPSPRVRLLGVLKEAFTIFRGLPILQFITGGDLDVLFRRLPAERLHQHLSTDRQFIEALVSHCRISGIPIKARPEDIIAVAYPIVVAVLHENGFGGQSGLGGGYEDGVEMLLELVAAFCLGEVKLCRERVLESAATVEGVLS